MAKSECAERLSADLLAAWQITDVVTAEPEDMNPTPPVLSPSTSTGSGSSERLLTPSQTRSNSLATLPETGTAKRSSGNAMGLGLGLDLEEADQTWVSRNPLWPEAKSPKPRSQVMSTSPPDSAWSSIPPRVLKSTPTPELGRHEYPSPASATTMPPPSPRAGLHCRTFEAPDRLYHLHHNDPRFRIDSELRRPAVPAASCTPSPQLSCPLPCNPHFNTSTSTHSRQTSVRRQSAAPQASVQSPLSPPIPASLLARYPTWQGNGLPKELHDKISKSPRMPRPSTSAPPSPLPTRAPKSNTPVQLCPELRGRSAESTTTNTPWGVPVAVRHRAYDGPHRPRPMV